MATPVTFGDIVAGIKTINVIAEALKSSAGASAEYQELIDELYQLERCLIRVKNLELDGSQMGELAAIQASASLCQRTIDNFGATLAKYQPHLRAAGSGSLVKDAWMKIRWSVCKKEDLAKFKNELMCHRSAITMQLSIILDKRIISQNRWQEEQSKTMAGKLQDGFFAVMGNLQGVTGSIHGLGETAARILGINFHIFKMVLDLHNIVTHIPRQVERDQPVYLTDAFDRTAPFHLEFITSKAAFLAVLEDRFSKFGQEKVRNKEFALQIRGSKADIDFQEVWENWFSPGQRVDMSMLLNGNMFRGGSCPSCDFKIDASENQDVECPHCGRKFRFVVAVEYIDAEDSHGEGPEEEENGNDGSPPQRSGRSRRKRRIVAENNPLDFDRFRRFRMIQEIPVASEETSTETAQESGIDRLEASDNHQNDVHVEEQPRGILRRPTARFPEDPNPVREGVAPRAGALADGIPPGAKWTKIAKALVSPEALREANERFEVRQDHVIILRPVSRDDVQIYADRTKELRDERYEREGRVSRQISRLNRREVVPLNHLTPNGPGLVAQAALPPVLENSEDDIDEPD